MAVTIPFVCNVGAAKAAEDAPMLFPVTVDKVIGFIDASGQIVVPPAFQQIRQFSEGLAAVQSIDSGLWGYLNQEGQMVIAPQFISAFFFQEGLAAVQLQEKQSYGFIDKAGRWVIPPGKYTWAGVVPRFYMGRARIFEQNSAGEKTLSYIDKTGAVVLRTPFEQTWDVYGDRIPFLTKGKVGFMSRDGQIIIEARFERYAYPWTEIFSDAIAPVALKKVDNTGNWGFIDKSGHTVLDFQYSWAEPFSEGLAIVSDNYQSGFVDPTGRIVVPLQFDEVFGFHEGLAAVKLNGLWGFIDTSGNMAIPPQFAHRRFGPPVEFHEGLAVIAVNTQFSGVREGVIDRTGKIVVAPIFSRIDDFSGGLAEVWIGGKKGYVNKQGEYVWMPSQ